MMLMKVLILIQTKMLRDVLLSLIKKLMKLKMLMDVMDNVDEDDHLSFLQSMINPSVVLL